MTNIMAAALLAEAYVKKVLPHATFAAIVTIVPLPSHLLVGETPTLGGMDESLLVRDQLV